jgi:F-type H+-transporting ATPase subunit b
MSGLVEISIGKSFIVQIVNFLVLLFLLNTFLFKPIIKFLENRNGTIQGNKEAAERSEREAEELLDSYLKGIEGVNRDSAESLAEVRREEEDKRREILEDTREKAELMLSQALEEIRKDAQAAEDSLKEGARENSRRITEKLLGRSLV